MYNSIESTVMNELIEKLSSKESKIREDARLKLVGMGHQVIDQLEPLLNSDEHITRWEAAKTLVQIHDEKSAAVFVKHLENDDMDIRWLAAEGLIKTGKEGLKHLLKALIEKPDTYNLRKGAHHVLIDTNILTIHKQAKPLIEALGSTVISQIPVEADKLLKVI